MLETISRTLGVAIVLIAIGTPVAVAVAGERYVALGDSYSSGTGTRTYFDAACQKSIYAYPSLVDVQRPNTDLIFAACAGARTGDVLSSQISSLTADTRWVTITVGGNDAGFSSVIAECAQPSWFSNCNGAIDSAQSYIRNTLPGQLDHVYATIRTRSPTATVIVLSYPRLFAGVDCNAATFLSADEMSRLNQTADLLRDTTRARVTAAGANFRFGDALGPFVGHAVCSSSAWLNGLSNPIGDSYHPNRSGHADGYAPLVRSLMG
jgi:lysophospholipase L1-like esterase